MIELFPSGMWHPHGINTHQATTPARNVRVHREKKLIRSQFYKKYIPYESLGS